MIYPSRPQFREDWAPIAQRFAALRDRAGKDRGIGDTIKRIVGDPGIEQARAELRDKHKLHCAKCNPVVWLNRLFGYHGPTRKANSECLAALRDVGHGKMLIIIANGPSHAEAGLERLKGIDGIDTMTVNRPYLPAWPTTYWVFVDPSVGRHNIQTWNQYKGIVLHGHAVPMYHPNAILIGSSNAFQTDILNYGAMVRPAKAKAGTTTLVAMQAACYLGYDKVYIFGLDMAADKDGKLYPWGSNPVCPDKERVRRFSDENDCLELAAKSMGKLSQRFTVCSSYATAAGWSFLKHFPTLPHETAVDAILGKSQ